jgi:hypothetical protein
MAALHPLMEVITSWPTLLVLCFWTCEYLRVSNQPYAAEPATAHKYLTAKYYWILC